MCEENGIYIIKNLINNKVYIGQTNRKGGIKERLGIHKTSLKGNYHKNKHLQSAWNKYGEDNFSFEALEIVEDINLIDEREIYWISSYDSTNHKKGYNKELGGCLSKKKSTETKNKMSESKKGTLNSASKITEEQAKEIKILLSERIPPKVVSKKLNVSHVIVMSIKSLTSWKHILPELNCKLKEHSITSIITENQAQEIKMMLSEGKSVIEISEIMNVKYDVVKDIKRLKTWKYILPELNYKIKEYVNTVNFNDHEIELIREQHRNGKTQTQLAKEWNCTQQTISSIVNYKGKYSNIIS